MRNWSTRLWTGAIALSLLLHGGAAAILSDRGERVEVAGGEPVDIAILGNAFEDTVAAGEVADTVNPAEPVSEAPVETPVETAEIVESPPPPVAVPQPVEAEAAAQAEAVAVEAEGTVAIPQAERAQEPEQVATVAREAAEAVEAEAAEAVLEEEVFAEVTDAPIPQPRPDFEAIQAERQRQIAQRQQQEARRQEAQRQQVRQPATGSQGQSQADARRGTADGAASGQSAQSAGEGRQAAAAGNATVSNYPGQVVSRLQRSLRYPSQARRQRITGEVHVAFTVAANGAVSGVRVVRSSGHAVLDETAVQTVHRAAPFPAIPQAAGRSNWAFTVPLAFTR